MTNFKTNKITNNKDLIASDLKNTREENNITIQEVCERTRIKKEYIEALENGEYNKLPQGVYGKNYLRQYAIFLRLNEKKMMEMYDDEFKTKTQAVKNEVFSRKVPKAHLFLIVPRIVKNFLLFLVVCICLAYLSFYVNNIIKPPKLEIFYPVDDVMISKENILINGQTEIEADVQINNEKVLTDQSGVFKKEIDLRDGVNIINIIAQKKYSRKNIKEIKVVVKK